MGDLLAVPLHLAVHISGFGFAAGLAALAVVRRRELPGSWLALTVGAVLLAASSVVVGGLWAQGLAWPLYVRAMGYATLAYGVAGRLGATAAVAPALPAASHLVAAVAGGLAAVATLGGVLGRGRQILLLSIGIGLLAAGDLLAVSRPTLGAVVSLAGAVAGLSWLAQRASRSLAWRFVASFAAVLLVVVLVLASASAALFQRDLQGDRLELLAQQAVAQEAALADDARATLARALTLLVESRDLPARLVADEASDATAASVARFVPTADDVVLTNASGRVLGSFDRQTGGAMGAAATVLAGSDLLDRARSRLAPAEDVLQLELVDSAPEGPELLAVAVRPLFPTIDGEERRDRLAGLVVAASRLTRLDRLDQVARTTGAEVAVLAGQELAGTTAGTPAVDEDLADLAGTSGGQVTELGGQSHFVHVQPIEDAAGDRVGSLVLFEAASVIAGLQELVTRVLFLAAVVGGLLATGLSALLTARATRPIRRLTAASERIAAGDLDVEVPAGTDDEVGRLAVAFGDMATALGAREADLRSAARRESTLRQRLESVTSSMDEGLLAVDADGTVSLANPAVGRLLGVDPAELEGRPLGDVLVGTAGDGDSWPAALGRPGSDEVRAARGQVDGAAGRPVTVAATAAPLVTDRGEAGRVVVVRDVTAEAQLDRMKDEFVSNAAHELRTPLTAVVGYLGTLRRRDDLDDERRQALLATAADGADRLRGIVDQLVWFADLEAGRARVVPQPTSVSDLVDEVLASWRHRRPDRTFRRRVARRLPDVHVDPLWTRRALDELVANAVKFSEDRIVLRAQLDDDGDVRLEVRDRGVGIPDDRVAEIRAEFRQADASATRHHGGLGLGLAIVERILDRQDATLDVESEVGQGTHVALVLPPAP